MQKDSGNEATNINVQPAANGQSLKIFSQTTKIDIDDLIPFENHPFKLYEGQRFTDMVESVRARGVLVPIVVRPHAKEKGKYEILSGHNRVNAAKATEQEDLKKIPAIIRTELADDDAMLVVTETNLIQRSFADLKHSEKAIAIATHYEAMKKNPGYRSDLQKEIETLTGAPVGHGMKTRDKLGSQYSLGKTTVARYLRVNQLIPELKERLDNDGIGMRVAEALSFLKQGEQAIVDSLLSDGVKISIKQADALKKESATEASSKKTLSKNAIKKILESEQTTKVKPLKLSGQFLSQHFNNNQSAEEIEKVIAEAMKYYSSKEST